MSLKQTARTKISKICIEKRINLRRVTSTGVTQSACRIPYNLKRWNNYFC
jgi:hypothetical protein